MFDEVSTLAQNNIPFLFISDFLGQNTHVIKLSELDKHNVSVSFDESFPETAHALTLQTEPLAYEHYKDKFNQVIENIKAGNTYLLNLTQPTSILNTFSLEEIFTKANAPYKLRYKDQFVCFSPEKFVEISGNKIATYPMKGTMDASVDNARELLLNNQKELAEHTMVVDLLRNDLGIVASDIKVETFRYLDKIKAGNKKLLQMSSKITGKLKNGWEKELGGMLKKLLPAGSISGTPKKKTVELINTIEQYNRGYFSGIFGIYRAGTFKSAVMIRFIENNSGKLTYKSGGGITIESECQSEYNEMLEKVYIP